MSGRAFSPRVVVLAVLFVLAGAAFYLLVFDGRGWWWDGFYLAAFGMLVGQLSGLCAMSWVRRWEHADGPLIVGNAAGIVLFMAVWLCLPADAVAVVAHVARALVGGAIGLVLVLGVAALSSEPYEPRQGNDESA